MSSLGPMPTKPVFSPEQLHIIREAAQRVWEAKFEWMRKTKNHPGGQEAMALALGISQQSVSNLLKGKYNPGWKIAANIANLDGHTLDQLLAKAPMEEPPTVKKKATGPANLTRCVEFYEASGRVWSPWTIAAARAGFFGVTDYPPLEWADKLDMLEKFMEKGRKAS